jgi:hypothetical protein
MTRVIDRYDVLCYECGAKIGTITVTDEDNPIWMKRDIKLLCDSCFKAWRSDGQ